tara:strand:- start:3706 stop:4431 length:726 start_codon:yes stop_codon:yes gene_type:complete
MDITVAMNIPEDLIITKGKYMKDMNIHEKLNIVQTSLKVEKGHRNDFGKYNYRNLADIFQGVKQLLNETGCYLIVSDEIVNIGGSNYIKATATFGDGNDEVSVNGYARESVSKKGMDDSQITGATSSYARKYACNGLFAIDDTADADSMDNRNHISELRKNTKGEVKTLSEDTVKLKRLSNSKWFKNHKTKTGLSINAGVDKWLAEKDRSDDEVVGKYAQLKVLEETLKAESTNKKVKETK